MTLLPDLPQSILLEVVDSLDSSSRLQLGLVAKFISPIGVQKLWHTPVCKSPIKFELLIRTLTKSNTIYPYIHWLTGLRISFLYMQTLPHLSHLALQTTVQIKTLRLVHIRCSKEKDQCLTRLFNFNTLKHLEITSCSNETVYHIANHLAQQEANQLETIDVKKCHVSDFWMKDIARSIPQLKYFGFQESGYTSDAAIIALAQNCPLIQTIIVTLPNYIIQSNTMTMLSLQSLSQCAQLKRFICQGQVRISTQECQDWMYANCPSLTDCDLSFQ